MDDGHDVRVLVEPVKSAFRPGALGQDEVELVGVRERGEEVRPELREALARRRRDREGRPVELLVPEEVRLPPEFVRGDEVRLRQDG